MSLSNFFKKMITNLFMTRIVAVFLIVIVSLFLTIDAFSKNRDSNYPIQELTAKVQLNKEIQAVKCGYLDRIDYPFWRCQVMLFKNKNDLYFNIIDPGPHANQANLSFTIQKINSTAPLSFYLEVNKKYLSKNEALEIIASAVRIENQHFLNKDFQLPTISNALSWKNKK